MGATSWFRTNVASIPDDWRLHDEFFQRLQWRETLKIGGVELSPSHLAELFSSGDISDEVMDAVMALIASRAAEPADTRFSTLRVFGLEFQTVLTDGYQVTPAWLKALEKDVMNRDVDRIIFPMHVHGNHWVACELDLKEQLWYYSDSKHWKYESWVLAPIHRWVKETTGVRKQYKISYSKRGDQFDDFSCGVCVWRTIEADLFQSSPWGDGNGVKHKLRVEYAARLLRYARGDEIAGDEENAVQTDADVNLAACGNVSDSEPTTLLLVSALPGVFQRDSLDISEYQ